MNNLETPSPTILAEKNNQVSKQGNTEQQIFSPRISIFYNLTLFILIISSFFVRVLTLPAFAEARDSLFFIRGVQHYSVANLSPHWPGYPVYIWLGDLFRLFFTDPTQSLHFVSIVATTLTILPISSLARSWYLLLEKKEVQANIVGIFAGFLWALVPLSFLNGSEIFSDPLALLLATTLLRLCWQALRPDSRPDRWLMLAAGVGGLMLGVRLSYVTLLLPLVYVTWLKHKPGINWRGRPLPLLLPLVALSFLLAVSVWFSWQWKMEGMRFFEAADTHLEGHFEEWGGSVTTDHNLLSRPARFIETGLVYGLGGWWPNTPLLRIPITLLFLFLIGNGFRKLVQAISKSPVILTLLWLVPYALWILFGNDVDLNRYWAPLVAILCIIASIGLPRTALLKRPVLVTTMVALSIVVIPLAIEHKTNAPIGQKLVSYVTTKLSPLNTTLIITDDVPTFVFFMSDEAPKYRTLRMKEQDIDPQLWRLEAQGRDIYATLSPVSDHTGWLPVARLCRGQFMESRGPLEVIIYKHLKNSQAGQTSSIKLDASNLECFNQG